jgi:hypothetical protein
MHLLDAFRGHLTPQVKSVTHAVNTDLGVIPGRMASQKQALDDDNF